MSSQNIPHTHYFDLLYELTRKELNVRYKHLAFGYLWSIASPLASVLIYYIVFQKILKVPQPNYILFLAAGLYPWQWIANSIGVAPTTFCSNATLIKKTLFPRFLIPLVMVAQDAIHFCLTIPIILAMVLYSDLTPGFVWLWAIPLLVISQFILLYALNLLIATLTLFFRDIERLVQIFMSFAFYLTPILYSQTMIPKDYHYLIPLNPFALLLINWRNILLENTLDTTYLLYSWGWCLGLLFVCQTIYKHLSWRFAEIL